MRAARFVGVGMIGFACQLLVLETLTRVMGVHYTVAAAIAVEVAILQNFAWHERWTWNDRRAAGLAIAARLLRFNAASGALSLVGNVGFTMLFVEVFRLPVLAANTLAVATLSLANYLIADRYVFGASGRSNVGALPRRLRFPGLPTQWLATTRAAVRGVGVSLMNAFRVVRDVNIRVVRVVRGLNLRVVRGVRGENLRGVRGVNVVRVVCGLSIVLSGASVEAADITHETVAAWNRYVAEVEARLAREAKDPSRFLSVDFSKTGDAEATRRRLRSGEVLVEDVEMRSADVIEVPGGMIHHWRGYVFIPNTTVAALVAAGKEPTGKRAHRQEDVLESRVLSRNGDSLTLFLKLQRRNIVTVAYNTEHVVSYRQQGPNATSRSISSKIAEIENAGTSDEHEKPVGHDRGFMWRLNSYWRYQAVDGGVLVELESLTLSRDIPWGFGTIVRPLIDRVARESVARTLTSMRNKFVTSETVDNRQSAIDSLSRQSESAVPVDSRQSEPIRTIRSVSF